MLSVPLWAVLYEECILKRDKQNRGLWLGLGLAIGVTAGALVWWKRQRARATSPLRCTDAPRTALITGASSGIGAVYARRLARDGFDLVLVARREARLQALAGELMQRYNVRAEVLVADLADAEDISSVEARIAELDDLCFLVNNAGFGLVGSFADNDITVQDAMIHVHVQASVRLTRAALPVMLAQHRGAIVNVASLAAFYPLPGSATYAATKAYLKTFTEALHQELAGTGVRVQALCPGFTRTELQDVAGIGKAGLPDFVWMSPEAVVEQSLRDLDQDRVISVPGWGYRLLAAVSGFLPRGVVYAVLTWLSRRRHNAHETFDGFPRRTYTSLAAFLDDVRFIMRHRDRLKTAMRVLDETFRERLMLAVTQVNRCRYCTEFHAKYALEAGLSQEEIEQLLEGIVEQCPPDEVTAILYARHWAEEAGAPDPEIRQKLVDVYGEGQADAIDMVLRMIWIGNLSGNTFDYLLYRISGGRWGN